MFHGIPLATYYFQFIYSQSKHIEFDNMILPSSKIYQAMMITHFTV